MLDDLLGEHGLLKDSVDIRTQAGQMQRVKVEWHLYSDMKLLLIVLGLKAGGAHPCLKCQWPKDQGMTGEWPPRKPDAIMASIIERCGTVLDLDTKVIDFLCILCCYALTTQLQGLSCGRCLRYDGVPRRSTIFRYESESVSVISADRSSVPPGMVQGTDDAGTQSHQGEPEG